VKNKKEFYKLIGIFTIFALLFVSGKVLGEEEAVDAGSKGVEDSRTNNYSLGKGAEAAANRLRQEDPDGDGKSPVADELDEFANNLKSRADDAGTVVASVPKNKAIVPPGEIVPVLAQVVSAVAEARQKPVPAAAAAVTPTGRRTGTTALTASGSATGRVPASCTTATRCPPGST